MIVVQSPDLSTETNEHTCSKMFESLATFSKMTSGVESEPRRIKTRRATLSCQSRDEYADSRRSMDRVRVLPSFLSL